MIVRREESKDFARVFELNSQAFEGDTEARLVEALRKNPECISLVAEIDGQVVGHIAFSPLTLNDEATAYLGLAPMAVIPDRQRTGLGSALIKEGIARAAASGIEAIFVLGHPSYYPKFGFEPAKRSGFACEYPDADDAFMALELRPGSLAGKSGLIKYGPEFAMF